ncbi:MAG: hypothetical protein AAF725_09505, partial [Acidobacteriota bacterium]
SPIPPPPIPPPPIPWPPILWPRARPEDPVRFAVATFQRVFDTVPNRDVVGLERLVAGLTSFMVKPETLEAVHREEERIERAWRSVRGGRFAAGPHGARLQKAWRAAEARGSRGPGGERPAEAAEREYLHLLREARSAPKRDLRLWSPALYGPDVTRASENVLHLSCLVLDYDGGVSPDLAAATWEEYFHILHSTWSHTPERPKFRVVLPLAAPVKAEDWPAVYAWAQRRADGAVDPTGKSLGTTFALPAVAAPDRPRLASSAPGPLLDALVEGLIEEPAEPPSAETAAAAQPTGPNHFRVPIPGRRVVRGALSPGEAPEAEDDAWDDSAFPWT